MQRLFPMCLVTIAAVLTCSVSIRFAVAQQPRSAAAGPAADANARSSASQSAASQSATSQPTANENESAASQLVAIDASIQQLKTGDSLSARMSAAERLGDAGPYAQAAVPALQEALQSEKPGLVYVSLMAISRIGPLASNAHPTVSELVLQDNVALHAPALFTLRNIGAATDAALNRARELTDSSNEDLLVAAVRCLVALEGPESVDVSQVGPKLVNAMAHRRASIGNAATSALVELGPDAVTALRYALDSEALPVRLRACDAISRIGPEAAELVPGLIDRLDDENPTLVRAAAQAIQSLAPAADAQAVLPELVDLLKHPAATVRATALNSLAAFGASAKSQLPLVLTALRDDQHPLVRVAAADAIGAIAAAEHPKSASAAEKTSAEAASSSDAAAHDASDQQAMQALLDAITDQDGRVTIHAANALSQFGKQAVPLLMQLMQDESYRVLAVTLLGELGPDAAAAVPEITALLQNADRAVSREAFLALAAIGPKAGPAVPRLLKILTTADAPMARVGAAYALGNIGDPQSVTALQQVLQESYDVKSLVQQSVAWALTVLQPDQTQIPVVMPYLVAMLDSEEVLARREALEAIAGLSEAHASTADQSPAETRIGAQTAQKIVTVAAQDSEPAVRADALHALGVIGWRSEKALAVAINSLQAPDPELQNAAAFLLGNMGSAAADSASELKARMRTGPDFNRMVAAWALLRVQPNEQNAQLAVPLLLKGLNHFNPRLRQEAADTLALANIRSESILTALNVAVQDPVPAVQQAARNALQQLRELP